MKLPRLVVLVTLVAAPVLIVVLAGICCCCLDSLIDDLFATEYHVPVSGGRRRGAVKYANKNSRAAARSDHTFAGFLRGEYGDRRARRREDLAPLPRERRRVGRGASE